MAFSRSPKIRQAVGGSVSAHFGDRQRIRQENEGSRVDHAGSDLGYPGEATAAFIRI